MRFSYNFLTYSALLCAGASFLPVEQAYAQTVDAPAVAGDAVVSLTPIVVTAQRRSENSQRVPIAIQHIDGKAIANAGYTDLTDLQYLAPGVQFDPTNGSAFQVRGVGSQSFDFSNAKSVSVVVDDVVMDAQRANGLIGLSDIANVDVLMGPQGTLFGMNSTSGVISVTTNKPQLGVTSVRGSASYGEHNDRILNGTVNLPVGQDMALRLSAFNNAQDGFGRNVTLNRNVGDRKEYGFRGRLLYQPSDRFDILVSGDYAHHWDSSVRTPAGGQPARVTAILNSLGVYPTRKTADTADSSFGYIRNSEWGASVRLHAKIGDNDLTSISAYRGSAYENSTPIDLVPATSFGYTTFNVGHLTTKKFSEEVHFASPTGRTIEYLVGGIWNRLDATQSQYQWGPLGSALTPVDGTRLFCITCASGQGGNTQLFKARNESIAAFGQLKLNLSDRFSVAVAGRFTHDRNSQGLSFITTDPRAVTGFSPVLVATGAGPVQSYGVDRGSNASVRVSPQYRFNDNVMAYFTFSTGYKPGGIAFVSNRYNPFKKETVKSYEAGVKSEWWNHRLRVNVDLFREDFTDFQASLLTTVPGTELPVIAIGNAGGLRSQGVEGNIALKPTRSLSLSGSLTYTDAHFTDYRYNTTTDYTGTRLTNSPAVSANASIDYEHGLGETMTMRAHVDYAYRSTAWEVIGQPSYSKQPAYSLVNARVSLLPANEHLEAGIYARNLFNQYFSTGWVYSAAIGYLHYTSPAARRTIGGFVNFKF